MRSQRVASRLPRLGLCLSAVLSIACLGMPSAQAAIRTAAPVSLVFQTWDPPTLYNQYLQPCQKQLPDIHVTVHQTPRTGYEVKLQTQFAAGDAPDAFLSPEDITMKLAQNGLLLDQAPYRRRLGLPSADAYVSGVVYRTRNELWGVAPGINSILLSYNTKVFQEAHVAPPPSDVAHAWTWSQFVAVARRLTIDNHGRHPGDPGFDARHIQRYGVNVPLTDLDLLPMIYSNLGRAYDASYRHFLLNQPAATTVIQDVADLALKDHVMPTPTELTTGAGSISIATGRVAMQFDGNWALFFYQVPKKTFPFGIGVLPRFKTYQTITFGPPYVISAHTAHPTAAMKLVGCILNHFGPLTKQALITPAKKSTLSAGYETWGDSPYFPSNYRSVVVDAVLNHAHDTPLNHMTQYISSWTNLVAPALDQVASGKKTASQAMNAIKAQEDALLARP